MKILEKKDTKVWCSNKEYNKILSGIISKEDNFVQFMGEKNIFITDDAESGKLADSLRAKGELVYGGSKESDRMENERSYGQEVMKKVGINTVTSHNFKGNDAYNKAIEFVKSKKGRWVIKQNGNQDKSYSTVGKFEDGTDILDKLNDFKHLWTEDIDFDIQEFVDGHEVGVSAFFNGKDWIRDTKGEPIFIENWEHKKKSEGDTGRTTGETGTLGYRSTIGAPITKELSKMTEILRKIKYIGEIDINFILSKKDMKFYGLEFTNRFGYPSLNMEQEMIKTPWSELIERSIKGENNFVKIDPSWCVVIVIQVPPFPFHTLNEKEKANGQRIYFTNDGKWTGKDVLTNEKIKHIHLYEVKKEKETGHILVSGDTGYLMTVTAQGNTPKEANDRCLNFINKNITTSNIDYRKDIGVNRRVKEGIEVMMRSHLL